MRKIGLWRYVAGVEAFIDFDRAQHRRADGKQYFDQ
jgi:hypothetical protein